jgi:hypothetical protein
VILETGEDPGLTAAMSFVLPSGAVAGQPAPSLSARVGVLPWFVLSLAIIMGATVLIVIINVTEGGPDLPPAAIASLNAGAQRFEIVVAQERSMPSGGGSAMVLSPDGRRLAWVEGEGSSSRLFVRALDAGEPRELPATEGAHSPFFSRDGEWIGFFDATHLKKVNVAAGAPLKLAEVSDPHGGTWVGEGRIVFAPDATGGLYVVDASGGEPERLTGPEQGETSHRWPHAARDEWVAFAVEPGEGSQASRLAAVSLDSGEQRLVHPGGSYPRIVGRHLLFVQEGTLFAARVDGDLAVDGEPLPILEGILSQEYGDGGAQYDAVKGALVYRRVQQRPDSAHVVLGFEPGAPLTTAR